MKPRIPIFLLGLFLLVSWCPNLPAQGGSSAASEEKLSTAEIDKLAKLLGEWRAFKRYARSDREERAKEKARASFLAQIEKVRKAHAKVDVLSLVDSWRAVFTKLASASKPKAAAGKGRVKKEKVSRRYDGRDQTYEYGLYIPSRYAGSKSWPLILALHDEGTTGDKYLSHVWANTRQFKKNKFYDQFIILAPTVGERTVGKKRDQVRIEPFGQLHRRAIALCLVDVLAKYNVDTDRMYLDGTGRGGQMASLLATMQSKLFAAVAIRSAPPRRHDILPNLKNQAELLFAVRKDGVFSTDDGKTRRQQIEHLFKVEEMPVSFKEYEPIPRAQQRRALGGQKNDPIVEATPEIAEFFLSKRRQLYPAKLQYITFNAGRYKQAAWLSIDKADAREADGTTASVKATIDRAENKVALESYNVESFRVYLNDRLVDLDKEVKIELNGQPYLTKEIDRTLDYMLGFNKANPLDPGLVISAEVRINVPPPEEENQEQPDKDDKGGDDKDK